MEWQTRWRERWWRLALAAVGVVTGIVSLAIDNWPFVVLNWALAVGNIALFVWTPRWLLDPEDGREGDYTSPSVEEMIAAEQQAQTVLRAALTDREWGDYREHGYIEVASPTTPGRVYRVPAWRSTVKQFEQGRLVSYLCVQPVSLLPPADVVLMHKLLIEGDEARYLATANRWDARQSRTRTGTLVGRTR